MRISVVTISGNEYTHFFTVANKYAEKLQFDRIKPIPCNITLHHTNSAIYICTAFKVKFTIVYSSPNHLLMLCCNIKLIDVLSRLIYTAAVWIYKAFTHSKWNNKQSPCTFWIPKWNYWYKALVIRRFTWERNSTVTKKPLSYWKVLLIFLQNWRLPSLWEFYLRTENLSLMWSLSSKNVEKELTFVNVTFIHSKKSNFCFFLKKTFKDALNFFVWVICIVMEASWLK